MSAGKFLPRRLNTAFSRLAFPESAKSLFAMQQGNPAYVTFWDDFLGDALDARYPADLGVNSQVVGVTAAIGGTMTVATAAADGDTAGQAGPGLHWNGDNGCY